MDVMIMAWYQLRVRNNSVMVHFCRCSFLFVHLDFFNLQDALCFNLLWKLKTGFNIETPGVSAAEKRVNKDSRDLNSNCLVTNYFWPVMGVCGK